VTSDSQLSFAVSRLLGGLTCSLGLILLVVAGAELFTGNNLLVLAWASQRLASKELRRNWLGIAQGRYARSRRRTLVMDRTMVESRAGDPRQYRR